MAVFSGMVGVTIFGVILTPVFFYIIDVLSESSWFSSPRVRRIGGIVLGILTLSYLWRPSLWRVTTGSESVVPAPKPGHEHPAP